MYLNTNCKMIILMIFWLVLLTDSVPGHTSELGNMFKPYDVALLPISDDNIKEELSSNTHNVDLMVQVIRHASQQNQQEVALQVMKDIRKNNPEDPYVLAEYCVAYDHANLQFAYHRMPMHDFSSAEREDYKAAVAKLRKVLPDFWLTNLLSGIDLVWAAGTQEQALRYLLKAEKEAPDNSFVHWNLALVYGRQTLLHSEEKAKQEAKRAAQLKPVMIKACLLWQNHQGSDRRQADAAVLAAVPPGAELDPDTKARVEEVKKELANAPR